MKKLQNLGNLLSKEQQRKITGGYGIICTCPNGQTASCPNGTSSSNCFNVVYQVCEGQPATSCKTYNG